MNRVPPGIEDVTGSLAGLQADGRFFPRVDLNWGGDNSAYLLEHVIPYLRLSIADKQVLRWAYGADWVPYWLSDDGEPLSFEQVSDGESLVPDRWMDAKAKSPAGVVHDFINRIETEGQKHRTPDGKVWTAGEANALYRRVKKALGAGFRHRWRRWAGVTVSHWAGVLLPALKSWWR